MTDRILNLVTLLTSASAAERLHAAEQLARMETEARGAAVALVEACATDDDQLRDWIAAALEALGPPDAADVPKLAALVGSSSLDAAYWAVTLLGRLDAEAAPAVPKLIEALASHPEMPVRQRAAWALGKIGPAAGAARDALTLAAESPDPRLANLVREALGRL
jgi:HEAT repeat protein